MDAAPSSIEVAEAIKAVLLTTDYTGKVLTDVAFAIDPLEFIAQATKDDGLVDGVLIECGPAARVIEGRDLLVSRAYILTFMVSFQEGTSHAYFSGFVDAFADALALSPRLGFGNGAEPYPTARVKHDQLQEPDGQTRLQGSLANIHYVRSQLPVRTWRC